MVKDYNSVVSELYRYVRTF